MAKMHRDTRGALLFDCPCGSLHVIYPEGCNIEQRPRWQWNGSLDAPTLRPSLLVMWTEHGVEKRCHSFITDGRIEFCGDSTHGLVGQTVEIPAWED